jgi:hypothetical protein
MKNFEEAEKEIKSLHDNGLIFDYDFDYNNMNKLTFAINKEGYNLKDIISKLKDGEKILFMINDGNTWNGKIGNECKFIYNKKYDGSIYWEDKFYGDCVRVSSDKGSIKEWGEELDNLFATKQPQTTDPKRQMSKIKEIKITLIDGDELTFNPKHEGLIKWIRGVNEKPKGFMIERIPSDKEALIIVCGPQEIRNFFSDDSDVHYWIEQELNK